jgi:hypothetical protein
MSVATGNRLQEAGPRRLHSSAWNAHLGDQTDYQRV